MQLNLNQKCSTLSQIGKSNNSFIYKELDKEGSQIGIALKLIKHTKDNCHSKECAHLKNEFEILNLVRHPNIIQLKSTYHENITLQNKNFCAIEFELATTDLFDKMQKMYPKLLSPLQVRLAFVQIGRAIEHLHENNIAHNDIKLENIFLFEEKQIAKLADFGFATEQKKVQNASEQKQSWKFRCKAVLAPEILIALKTEIQEDSVPFDETKSDIWALGLCLFQCFFLRTPFEKEYASPDDPLFGGFYKNDQSCLWENAEISNILSFLENSSQDFKRQMFIDLINKMLETNPKERIDIQQVLSHPWFYISNKDQCSLI